jgi:hypothetical protein
MKRSHVTSTVSHALAQRSVCPCIASTETQRSNRCWFVKKFSTSLCEKSPDSSAMATGQHQLPKGSVDEMCSTATGEEGRTEVASMGNRPISRVPE